MWLLELRSTASQLAGPGVSTSYHEQINTATWRLKQSYIYQCHPGDLLACTCPGVTGPGVIQVEPVTLIGRWWDGTYSLPVHVDWVINVLLRSVITDRPIGHTQTKCRTRVRKWIVDFCLYTVSQKQGTSCFNITLPNVSPSWKSYTDLLANVHANFHPLVGSMRYSVGKVVNYYSYRVVEWSASLEAGSTVSKLEYF